MKLLSFSYNGYHRWKIFINFSASVLLLRGNSWCVSNKYVWVELCLTFLCLQGFIFIPSVNISGAEIISHRRVPKAFWAMVPSLDYVCILQGDYLERWYSFRCINSGLFAFKMSNYFYSWLPYALIYLFNAYLQIFLKINVVLGKISLKYHVADSPFQLMELR